MVNQSLFLDTNIVADMIDAFRVNHQQAMQRIKKLIFDAYDIFISEDMLSRLSYLSSDKKAHLSFLNM